MPFLVSEQCIEGRQRTSRTPYYFGKICAFEALFEKKLFRRIENSEAPAVEAIFGPASGLRPVVPVARSGAGRSVGPSDRFNHRPSARQEAVRSEEHTSELQSLMRNSYAVFCLKKKKTQTPLTHVRHN